MAGLARRLGIPRELPVAALVAAAALPLSRLFQPGGFTGVVLSCVVLSVALSWGARRLRLPAPLSLLISVAGMVWFISARFYPHSLFGVFPTPASIHAIIDGVHVGIHQTVVEAVPVVASSQLLMFVAAGIWLSAWLADAAAVWVGNPLLAIAATVPLFATPGTLLPSQRRWVDTGLYIAAAAWILYAEETARAKRWRSAEADRRLGWRAAPAVRIALAGLLVIIVLAPFLPGYGATPLLRSKGPGDRISFNPFVAIRPTLRQDPELTLFTVVTTQPAYFRLTTLEHYDGEAWRQGNSRTTVPIGGNAIAPFEPTVPARQVQQHYQIQALAGPWLPAEYDPVSVDHVDGGKVEVATRAIVLPEAAGLPIDAKYNVTSQMPTLTAEDLDQPFVYDTHALADYLETGGRVPSQVRRLAQSVAGDKPTPYQKALALQDYLRTFTYDENVAAGHSFKNIVEFLKVKRGYCEQFSATMALMARVLGIPSRVAIGFGFGQQVGLNEFRETTREAHAWVEIYFPSAGWVTFEPTPRTGVARVPAYAGVPGTDGGPTPTDTPTASATRTANPATPGSQHGPAEDAGAAQNANKGRSVSAFVAAIAAGVFVFVALVFVLTIALRALRRRRARDVRSAAAVRYDEFLMWCAGAGLGREPAETPLEHATRLGADVTVAKLPLRALAALADKALWSAEDPVSPDDLATSIADARSALRGTLNRRRRILAAAGWGRWRPAA